MLIKLAGTGQSRKHTFRKLVRYVVREPGVAAIRIAGGLDPKGTTAEWIAQMEQRAELVPSCSSPAVHLIVSLTHEERAIFGRDGLKEIVSSAIRVLGLNQNQRVGAVHIDAAHLHMHEICSRIMPSGRVVDRSNEQHELGALRLRLLKQYDLKPMGYAAFPTEARNMETWSRLPSFIRYAELAGRELKISESINAKDYLERWAKLGIWYERPTDNGGVLATLHDSRIVHIKASQAGFTPPKQWAVEIDSIVTACPSGYAQAVERAKSVLFQSEPPYRTFLSERNNWQKSGRARGNEIRRAMRSEREAFDRNGMVAQQGSSPTEASVMRELCLLARGDMLARHKAVRDELARCRPDPSYGVWLRSRARAGDVASSLSLTLDRIMKKSSERDACDSRDEDLAEAELTESRVSPKTDDLLSILREQVALAHGLRMVCYSVHEAREILHANDAAKEPRAYTIRKEKALTVLDSMAANEIVTLAVPQGAISHDILVGFLLDYLDQKCALLMAA